MLGYLIVSELIISFFYFVYSSEIIFDDCCIKIKTRVIVGGELSVKRTNMWTRKESIWSSCNKRVPARPERPAEDGWRRSASRSSASDYVRETNVMPPVFSCFLYVESSHEIFSSDTGVYVYMPIKNRSTQITVFKFDWSSTLFLQKVQNVFKILLHEASSISFQRSVKSL